MFSHVFSVIGAFALLLVSLGTFAPLGLAAPDHPVTYATADDVYPADAGFYNVRDFGARGDGVTDDTAAIRAAMQAALKGARQPNHGASAGAMFTGTDSRFSLSAIANDGGFPVAVSETRGGVTRTLPANGRRGGMEMGLFSGQAAANRP